MPLTLHVVPLEALGDFPNGQPIADVRDLLSALATRSMANPEQIGIAILTGRPSSELEKVVAWLGPALAHPALPVISRDDAFGAVEIPGHAVRWTRQRLRRGEDLGKIVFYSPRSQVLEEMSDFVAQLPRDVDFEGMHVRGDGAIARWFA